MAENENSIVYQILGVAIYMAIGLAVYQWFTPAFSWTDPYLFINLFLWPFILFFKVFWYLLLAAVAICVVAALVHVGIEVINFIWPNEKN
jgi:hypothetical protein